MNEPTSSIRTDALSREARALVNERRFWPRFWRRWAAWIALALVLAWSAFDSWWMREQQRRTAADHEEQLVLTQERCAAWGQMPSVVFVLEGRSTQEITDKLQRIETNALMLRMSERQGNVDTRVNFNPKGK